MRKQLASLAIAGALATVPVAPATAGEITTQTLAYSFVFALAGTAAGAILLPYAAPAAGPFVAGAYTTVTSTVNGATVGLGNLLLTEPRMTGAVLGMATGLFSGIYFYSE